MRVVDIIIDLAETLNFLIPFNNNKSFSTKIHLCALIKTIHYLIFNAKIW